MPGAAVQMLQMYSALRGNSLGNSSRVKSVETPWPRANNPFNAIGSIYAIFTFLKLLAKSEKLNALENNERENSAGDPTHFFVNVICRRWLELLGGIPSTEFRLLQDFYRRNSHRRGPKALEEEAEGGKCRRSSSEPPPR
jgi:hypothetical protein